MVGFMVQIQHVKTGISIWKRERLQNHVFFCNIGNEIINPKFWGADYQRHPRQIRAVAGRPMERYSGGGHGDGATGRLSVEIAAWTSLAFTGLVLAMTVSRQFFHEWVADEIVLGPVGWTAILVSVPVTVAIWLVAIAQPQLAEALPLSTAMPVVIGLVVAMGVIVAREVFFLQKLIGQVDNKSNLLVSIANRVNDVEVYLRILHYNLQRERRPMLPPEVRDALIEAGVLPADTTPGRVEDITEDDLAESDSEVRRADELVRTPKTEIISAAEMAEYAAAEAAATALDSADSAEAVDSMPSSTPPLTSTTPPPSAKPLDANVGSNHSDPPPRA